MGLVRKLAGGSCRAIALCGWLVIGLWTGLAVFYAAPAPEFLRTAIALAIGLVFIVAVRERCRIHRWFAVSWRQKRLTTAALFVTAAVLVCYFSFMKPDPDQEWEPEHARMPAVTIVGDKVHVSNARDFTWHTASDETPGYYDRDYDLSAINSMYYVLCPLEQFDGVAHVFLCFGFSDGQHVAVSVEGRRVKARPYQVIASMFRQYQLIYVVGDEHDIVGLRGAVWKVPVYFYPARISPDRMRAVFLDMMNRAHSLQEHPEYYNLITNNCLNNITTHLRRAGGRRLPMDLRLLLTGRSDRLAYDLGFVDTDLPFETARRVFRIDPWMQTTPMDEGFSRRLRDYLARQLDEAHSSKNIVR